MLFVTVFADAAIKIGVVGDSITAGACSSGGNHPYPQQLQLLLDDAYGAGKFSVTNLGSGGSTMLKKSNAPYWERSQYARLTAGKWDIVTIMLGSNDAKDIGSDTHHVDNWQHDCSGATGVTLDGCSYATDYASMIDVIRGLGTTEGVSPKIYAMISPPLMQLRSTGMNQTVINDIFPQIVPMIAENKSLDGVIDVFAGMGGVPNWRDVFPDKCVVNSSWAPCAWFCDEDTNDCSQVHPHDKGYAHLATVVQAGLGLTGPSVV